MLKIKSTLSVIDLKNFNIKYLTAYFPVSSNSSTGSGSKFWPGVQSGIQNVEKSSER